MSTAKKKIVSKKSVETNAEMLLTAVGSAFAFIEFTPDGTIRTANDTFLKVLGYSIDEIAGKHHRMFVDAIERDSLDYRRFWDDLARGVAQTREFKRMTKTGAAIWINASYMPLKDDRGNVTGVIKLAQDCTANRLNSVDIEGQLSAICKSQAVIEFKMDGTILCANDNFLKTVGYAAGEIIGQNHAMFVDHSFTRADDYKRFWDSLRAGQFQSAEYKRLGKNGKEIWIQASYNPIFDIEGKPFKVVKYATDITLSKLANANFQGQLQAISKSQAVIEFNLDGTIIEANDNFLTTLGYSMQEIRGKHHSMFVDESSRNSPAYRSFWEKLNRGDYDAGQYCRVAKNGREVWIQASYNPILDTNGKPYKVVKYATDITKMIELIKDLSDAANQLATSSSELNAAASEMSQNSARTNDQATAASNTSERVAKGVEEVATNTEEMQASIKEIARNANEASNMSSETKRQAISTNETIQKLGESSKEIGNVIKVISSIAQQTNLLALNATIEAARAGDAGRGFAVVANEVKELAKQTAKATEEITSKISAIQSDSSDAVKAISGIGHSIEKLNAIAGAIAASVEEQAATTSEVARVVRESNSGVQGITENVRSVSQAATQTSQGARQVMNSAQSLSELSGRLQLMVQSLRK
ncbi:MAG: PAS domain-containing methyl-accepting chemotaxis protein [Bdellovibrionota bacterium]